MVLENHAKLAQESSRFTRAREDDTLESSAPDSIIGNDPHPMIIMIERMINNNNIMNLVGIYF